MQEEKKLRAALYARFSCDKQHEESIEGQKRDCSRYAKTHNMVIVKEYIDRAVSAKTDNREQFQNMIRESRLKEFDVVLVWKLDRFARNRADSIKYKTMLKKNGVKVVSATEALGDGAESVILESVLEGMAEYYSLDLSEKVKRGMTDNALKCEYNGGSLIFGYKIINGKYVIDENEAPIVKEIFDLYLNHHYSIKMLLRKLEQSGVRRKNGKPIGFSGLRRMLSSRKYIGEYRCSEVLIKGGIPALIDKDTFDAVQEILVRNKRNNKSIATDEPYILSGKLFCYKCGSRMSGESGKTSIDENGNVCKYRYYKCSNQKRNGFKTCDCKVIPKHQMEDLVVFSVIKFLKDKDVINNLSTLLYDYQMKENPLLDSKKKELSSTEAKIENIMKALEMGIFTKGTKERLDTLEKEKDKFIELIGEEEIKHTVLSKEDIAFCLRQYSNKRPTTLEEKRTIVDAFVAKATLDSDDNGKCTLTVYYKVTNDKSTLEWSLSENNLNTLRSPIGLLPNLYLVGDCFSMKIHAGTSIFVGSKAR